MSQGAKESNAAQAVGTVISLCLLYLAADYLRCPGLPWHVFSDERSRNQASSIIANVVEPGQGAYTVRKSTFLLKNLPENGALINAISSGSDAIAMIFRGVKVQKLDRMPGSTNYLKVRVTSGKCFQLSAGTQDLAGLEGWVDEADLTQTALPEDELKSRFDSLERGTDAIKFETYSLCSPATVDVSDGIQMFPNIDDKGTVRSMQLSMLHDYLGEVSVIEQRRKRWTRAISCMIRAVDPTVTEQSANQLLSQLGIAPDSGTPINKLNGKAEHGDFEYAVTTDADASKFSMEKKSEETLSIEKNLERSAVTQSSAPATAQSAEQSPVASQPALSNESASAEQQPESSATTAESSTPKSEDQLVQASSSDTYERDDFTFAVPSGLFGSNQSLDKARITIKSTDGAVVTAWSSANTNNADPTAAMQSTIADNPGWRVTMKRSGPDWFVVSGYNNDQVFYQKTIVYGDKLASFLIEHKKEDVAKYGPATEMLATTFKTK